MVFIQHITGFDTWTILSLAFFASIAGLSIRWLAWWFNSITGFANKIADTNLVTIFGTNKIAGFRVHRWLQYDMRD
jgi:hypothetical protein